MTTEETGRGHTPGPWRWTDRVLQGAAQYAGYGDMGGFITADGTPVCWFGDNETYYPTEGAPPSEADKRLIAAAPDFFAAAKSLLDAWDARTTGAQQMVTGKSDRDLHKQAQEALDALRAAIRKATEVSQ